MCINSGDLVESSVETARVILCVSNKNLELIIHMCIVAA
jgi:hypothetical protein